MPQVTSSRVALHATDKNMCTSIEYIDVVNAFDVNKAYCENELHIYKTSGRINIGLPITRAVILTLTWF